LPRQINDLTVFIITETDSVNFEDCYRELNKQTVKFRIDIIRDYAPMSNAFQQMLERCHTPYYIQCDDDMILKNNSVEIMYDAIKNSYHNTSMLCYKLHDVHLDFDLFGVKIYKFECFKNYPYNLNTVSCEMDQLEQMKKSNWNYQNIETVVGLHSPKWTTEKIYERYFDLGEKYKKFKYQWIGELPNKLQKMLDNSKNEQDRMLNLYALTGLKDSMESTEIMNKEKDFRYKNPKYIAMKNEYFLPTRSTLFLTNKCNLKCDFCYRNNNDIEDFPDMNLDIVKTLYDKFPTIMSSCCCGIGEPLLSSNLYPIMEYLKKIKKVIGLITNGVLLREHLKELIKQKPAYISVSLNASNEQRFFERSKTHDFNNVVRGLELTKGIQVPIYVSYVCDKDNLKYIPEYLQLINKINPAIKIHLHNLLPHYKDNSNFMDKVLTTKDQHEIDMIKKHPLAKMIAIYPMLIDTCNIRYKCEFPWITLGVDGNSSITVCNSIFPPKKENGSIYDIDVWHNKYCTDFRNSFVHDVKDVCKLCFRNWRL
jgi:sulfatase maturation enzyme AslB (radical SAM superfamily)